MQRKKNTLLAVEKTGLAVGIFQGVQAEKLVGAVRCGLACSKYSKNFGGGKGIGQNEVQLPKLPAWKVWLDR